MLASTLQELAGRRLQDEDGHEQMLELEPPATEAEVRTLEGRAYQSATIEEFLRDTVAMWQAGPRSPVDLE